MDGLDNGFKARSRGAPRRGRQAESGAAARQLTRAHVPPTQVAAAYRRVFLKEVDIPPPPPPKPKAAAPAAGAPAAAGGAAKPGAAGGKPAEEPKKKAGAWGGLGGMMPGKGR